MKNIRSLVKNLPGIRCYLRARNLRMVRRSAKYKAIKEFSQRFRLKVLVDTSTYLGDMIAVPALI